MITYTLLVGSFPFAGRDGDNAMLSRIAAGSFAKERPAWQAASSTAKAAKTQGFSHFLKLNLAI